MTITYGPKSNDKMLLSKTINHSKHPTQWSCSQL